MKTNIPLRSLKVVQQEHIINILTEVGGHVVVAAEILGISRAGLYRKIDEYKINMGKIREESNHPRTAT